MRGRAIVPMVVGLAVGLVALKVFVNVLQKAKGASSEMVPMVYAATNIEPTLELKESMIEIRQVAKSSFPEAGFSDKSQVVGRVTSWSIPKGTPICSMQLSAKGTAPGMAVMIKEGYRAVAVKIDESAGVAGWIKPGSHVDVIALLTNPDPSSRSRNISKVILQDIEVLAVGQEIGKAGDTAAAITNTVTVLVKPNDVPKLHLAESKGKLRLAMRSQQDSALAKDSITTDNDLLGNGSASNPGIKPAGSSFLAALFSGQAKVGSNRTDKELQPEVTQVAVASASTEPRSCTVELYRGLGNVESVKFERSEAEQWRRADGQDRSTGSTRAATPRMPNSLFVPRPITAAAAGTQNENDPQAGGSTSGGPTGAQ